jgi:hypothetical protein
MTQTSFSPRVVFAGGARLSELLVLVEKTVLLRSRRVKRSAAKSDDRHELHRQARLDAAPSPAVITPMRGLLKFE